MKDKRIQLWAGFLLLFIIYHFPEFYNELWIAAVFKIGFLAVSYFVARYQGLKNLAGFGLNLHRSWVVHLATGLLTGFCFFALSVAISDAAGFEKVISIENLSVIIKQLPLILLMTVFPSVAEDILTRGYLFAHLKRKISGNMFIMLSAAVYVLNHIWRLGQHPSVLIYLFILGIALAFALWKTGSLWLAFGIHWGSNIAFESTSSFIKTTEITHGHQTTWVLAFSFLLMFIFLALILRRYRSAASMIH